MICAGYPNFLGLWLEVGHVSTFWLLLYLPGRRPHGLDKFSEKLVVRPGRSKSSMAVSCKMLKKPEKRATAVPALQASGDSI